MAPISPTVSSLASLLALACVLHACGPTAPTERSVSPSPSTVGAEPPPEPETAGDEVASANETSPPLMTADVRGTGPACAFASISLDSRALPTNTTPEGFDFWVRGEADDLRQAAPSGVAPRMYTGPGGHMDALFDGATSAEVLAACEATVTAYMATAPNLPLIGYGSAAHVMTPCRSCD